MTISFSFAFILVGVLLSIYFFKRYKKSKNFEDKLLEFGADLFTGANLLGPILIIIGLIGLLSELKSR